MSTVEATSPNDVPGVSSWRHFPDRPDLLARIECRGVIMHSPRWHRSARRARESLGWAALGAYFMRGLLQHEPSEARVFELVLAAILVALGVLYVVGRVHPATVEITATDLTLDWRFRKVRVPRCEVASAAAVEQWDGSHLAIVETTGGRRIVAYFDESEPAVRLARALTA